MLRSVGSFKEARWRFILLQGGRCEEGAQNTRRQFVQCKVVVEAGGHDFHPAVEALHLSSLSQASSALSWAGVF